MQYDGGVYFQAVFSDDGVLEGFQRIKDGMGSVSDDAKKMSDNINASFSKIDISKPIANATAKVESLERLLANATGQYQFAVSEGDDRGAETWGRKREVLYDRLEEARRKLALEITAAAEREARAEEKASRKAQAAAEKEAAAKEKAARKQFEAVTSPARKFGSRLREIVSGALVFNLISAGLREMTNYFGSALKSNDAFRNSFARLKGALLTAFQPIYEFVLPAIVSLMDILTKAVQVIGRFFAALSGKSYSQVSKNAESLNNEANAISGVGSAAKKAQKQLAGFDEINKLSAPDSAGGGGGGAGASIAPTFEDTPNITSDLEYILQIVGAIGAALLTWKIASFFTEDLSTIAGLALTVGGSLMFGASWADAFANGVDWKNLTGMIIGLAGAAGGLALIFGATGAAVALLIGGIALVVVALKDWITTGELSNEACTALVVGIMAIGAALAIFTGSWIPLLIAGVVALVLAIATKGDEIKALLQKLDDWLQGIFSRDWRETFGPVLGGILNGFFDQVKGIWDGVKQIFDGVIDFIAGVFSGDWKRAINGLLSILKGLWNTVKGLLLSPFNAAKEALGNLLDKLPDSWKNAINSVVAVVNKFINWLNKTLTFNVPPIRIAGATIFDGGSIKLVNLPNIPYLAQGAVLPPNNPFLAMVGDQKHGTNVEAPLSTIQEAVALVMEDFAASNIAGQEAIVGVLREILEAVLGIEIDGETLSRAVNEYQRKRNVVTGGT